MIVGCSKRIHFNSLKKLKYFNSRVKRRCQSVGDCLDLMQLHVGCTKYKTLSHLQVIHECKMNKIYNFMNHILQLWAIYKEQKWVQVLVEFILSNWGSSKIRAVANRKKKLFLRQVLVLKDLSLLPERWGTCSLLAGWEGSVVILPARLTAWEVYRSYKGGRLPPITVQCCWWYAQVCTCPWQWLLHTRWRWRRWGGTQ